MTAAVLVACSPLAEESPAADAEARPGAAARPETPERIANAQRPERRWGLSAFGKPAERYKYIDERGQVQIAARLEDIPERQRSTASSLSSPTSQARSRATPADVRAVNTAEVTIFSTPSCGYCRVAIAHFEKSGIEYVNRDVEADEEARAEYLELTGGRRGVPVIVVGDAWIQGWSQQAFERLLASARP